MNLNTPNNPLSTGVDQRLLLSYGQLSRSIPRSITVLDVASSTGETLIFQAAQQRDVLFTGIECNSTALTTARRKARETGVENVEFELVDFSTPNGIQASIEQPEGGFDVIQVASIPSEIKNLESFFTALQSLLAPHGVISLNLPGRKGHYAKVAHAIEGAAERQRPLQERLEAARELVDRMVHEEPKCADWRRASLVGDVEFVERYMQTQERHVDVATLFQAIEGAELSFLRWQDTTAWNFETLEVDRDELERLRALPAAERFAEVEAQRQPETLSLVLGGPMNVPRERFDLTKAGETHFMVHPDVIFSIEMRNLWGTTQYDRLSVRRGKEEAVEVRPSPAQTALFALRDQREPFSGLNLVEVMTAEGASLEDALLAVHQLAGLELIYRPHEFDVAQFFAQMLSQPRPASTGDLVVTPSLPQRNSFVPAAGEPSAPLPSTPVQEPARMWRDDSDSESQSS